MTGTHASPNEMTGIKGIGMMILTVAGDAGMMTTMVEEGAVVMVETAVIAEMATGIDATVTEMTDTLVAEAVRGTTTMIATAMSERVEAVVTGEVQQDVTAVPLSDAARHRRALFLSASDRDPTPSGTFLLPASKALVLSLLKRLACSVFQVRQD